MAGSRTVLETTSCLEAVDFLSTCIGNKLELIMDGGYTVFINNNFVLTSRNDLLFSWINRCCQKL